MRTTINSDAESTGMLEQRRLPNARVTPKHQDAALPSSSVGEQSIGLSELE